MACILEKKPLVRPESCLLMWIVLDSLDVNSCTWNKSYKRLIFSIKCVGISRRLIIGICTASHNYFNATLSKFYRAHFLPRCLTRHRNGVRPPYVDWPWCHGLVAALCVTAFINPWGAEGYCSCLVQYSWGRSQLLDMSFIRWKYGSIRLLWVNHAI